MADSPSQSRRRKKRRTGSSATMDIDGGNLPSSPDAAAESRGSYFDQKLEETFDSLEGPEAPGLTAPPGLLSDESRKEAGLPPTAPLGKSADDSSVLNMLRAIAMQQGFEVEKLLGRGGMGAVALARDRQLGRRVALKFLSIPTSGNRRSADRLKKEAERVSKLTHENIVQVYSWHSVGELTFFAMEYVEGSTLQEYVEKKGNKLAPADILRIMAEACAGVAVAHEQTILHRDIKPHNILISTNGRVKVADFGLASTTEESWRNSGSEVISGTIGFMAPEQARGETQGPASDVFSLAATLYYALTGYVPFGNIRSLKALLKLNQAGRVEPLYTARKDLPRVIYKIVARGLARDPDRRYRDATEMREALESALLTLGDDEGFRDPFHQVKLWVRRNALAAGLTGGLLLGLLLGVGVMYFLFVV